MPWRSTFPAFVHDPIMLFARVMHCQRFEHVQVEVDCIPVVEALSYLWRLSHGFAELAKKFREGEK